MAIVKRIEKGSALTHAEMDGNFTDLDTRISNIEGANDSDNQTLNLVGSLLQISGGNSVDLSPLQNVVDSLDDITVAVAAPGNSNLTYTSQTGEFVFTPPDLSSYLTSYTVTQADVTAHQAALSITESQISDLAHYDDTALAARVTTLENAGFITSETDSQTLTLVGTDLSITNGNTVDLSGFLTSYTETDPVVGAVTGIVKADGAGNISAAVAGTDYSTVASINDLSDVDTATIAPSRSMQPLIWDDIDQNWYPGNGISITANLTMEDNSFIMLRENAYLNFEGSITDGFDTQFSVVNPTANRTIRLPDADGTVALTGQALSSFNNDLDYAGIVGSTIQANGLPTGTTFTDTLTLPVLTAEPSSPVNGMVAVADGTSWDPMSNAAQTMVVYLAGAWRQIAQGGV